MIRYIIYKRRQEVVDKWILIFYLSLFTAKFAIKKMERRIKNELDLRVKTRLLVWTVGLWDQMKERTNRRKETGQIKEGRSRKVQASEKSTEKWKIENAPTAKKIVARIWRVENDVSKNPRGMMSKNTTEHKEAGKMWKAAERRQRTRACKERRNGETCTAHLTLLSVQLFVVERDFRATWIKLSRRSVISSTKCGMR